MSTIVEFGVPSTAFALGEALAGTPDVSLELERIVPTGREIVPFVWAQGDDLDEFQSRVEASQNVRSATELDRIGDKRLYRIAWGETPENLVRAMGEMEATILEGSGGGESWTFRLRFPDHDHLTEFDEYCEAAAIPIDIRRVYTLATESALEDKYGLTPRERKALELALDRGYFATPRRVELRDVAADLDITRQALSKRVRNATEKILQGAIGESSTK